MTINIGCKINTYLIKAMDMQNQFKAFREIILDKILNDIVFNKLL